VEDGLSLYGFLSSLPLELFTYNIGDIDSIATVVFLAGDTRIAIDNTTFFIHDESWTLGAQEYTDAKLKEFTNLLERTRIRAKSIFKLKTQLDQSFLDGPNFFKGAKTYEPSDAKSVGIVHEVRDVGIPFGARLLNIDWA
jgi:ATP-dependent Clp protease protease subunit